MEKTIEGSDYAKWKNWLDNWNTPYMKNTFNTHRKALDIETDGYWYPYIIFDMWGNLLL